MNDFKDNYLKKLKGIEEVISKKNFKYEKNAGIFTEEINKINYIGKAEKRVQKNLKLLIKENIIPNFKIYSEESWLRMLSRNAS